MEIPESDQQLIRRCLRKDRKAQFELYEKYKVRLFGLCRRYARSEAEAHDFLQEGFIKVFRSLHQYRADGPLVKWMERVVVNRILSLLRKKRMSFDDNLDLQALPVVQTSNADVSEKAETIIRLIRQLPLGYQTVFNLYALEGYSHQEIAQVLGISESTSRSQYSRAKKVVKTAFEQLKSVDS
jgi:RNA polymerase sigma-70 factor (ECF subfamily)